MGYRYGTARTGLRMGLAVLAGRLVFAGAPTDLPGRNLIVHGGFEEAVRVNVSTNAARYKPLLDRGVALVTGDEVDMPAFVYLNPADGWPGPGTRFAYVSGRAGVEVFAGTRAIRIESPNAFSAVAVGTEISVVEGLGLDDRTLQTGVPYSFALHAKGRGELRVSCYLYGPQGEDAIHDYGASRRVTPPLVTLTDDGAWRRYEGTLTITNPRVDRILLVVAVRGAVTLDDVLLLGQ